MKYTPKQTNVKAQGGRRRRRKHLERREEECEQVREGFKIVPDRLAA